ncbi:major facilitator superfamily domain-containing protein [Plectosphaerella cucumerina]|uniref:Major facilitator superfamily domain-containing protein n=1 Tax=Plectosphaerella cucumerina TaxID=40658 RepID=A0A8K0TSU5_9PEZI|nr:major facilitator superfamily domain-containing protein [Plectosphaerella cucumerina]
MGTEETEPQVAPAVRSNDQSASVDGPPKKKGLHFWVLLVSIALCQFLAALDSSVLSTALPTVAAELNSGPLYLWIVNTYLLAMTACGPIFGQAADIFGRKSLTLLAITAFALGSIISATAKSTEQLLVGRTIQGVGGAGCVVMPEILICDLVSLRERAMYVGILTACWGTGTLVAPVVGGALAEAGAWRWIFYLNLPIAGLAAVPMVMLKLRNPNKNTSFWSRLARVDWVGNAILIFAVVSLLMSLTYAGNKNPWSSWRTIVPLVLGCLGLVAFAAFEAGPWLPADSRTMPPRLFRNRTAVGGYATSFFHAMMLFWTGYFLPVYFQAVKGALPLRSAVMILPLILTSAPAGFLAGFFTSKTGRCLIWQFVGWGVMAVGAGLLTLLDAESSTGHWVGFQMVFGFGLGVIFTTQLPAILASLDEADVATASAVWIFIRNLGSIWGTTIPAAVFNTRAEELAISLPEEVRGLLVRGGAFEHATARFMNTFKEVPGVFSALLEMYTASLRLVWQISIAFCGVGFLLCFLMKNLELTSEHNTEWGLEGVSQEERAEQMRQGQPAAATT